MLFHTKNSPTIKLGWKCSNSAESWVSSSINGDSKVCFGSHLSRFVSDFVQDLGLGAVSIEHGILTGKPLWFCCIPWVVGIFQWGAFFLGIILFPFWAFFWGFLFPWFFAFLLFCFSAFCFSAFLLFPASAVILLCFPASPLFCFFTFSWFVASQA